MVKYDNWCNDCSLCDKRSKPGTNDCLLPYIENRLIKYPLSIQDGSQDQRWPPRNLAFLTFQHQTAVISRASSRSPCFLFLPITTSFVRYMNYFCHLSDSWLLTILLIINHKAFRFNTTFYM